MNPDAEAPDPAPPRKYGRAFEIKLRVQRALVAGSGAILTILVFVQVVTRYVFNIAIFGIEEVATYCAVWFYMLGAAIGAHERGHISASLVDLVVESERGQGIVKAFTALVGVLICAWMLAWSIEFIMQSYKMNRHSVELGMPLIYVHIAIPVGLALMTFYFLVELLEDVRFVMTGERP